jgi:hypothetical protein
MTLSSVGATPHPGCILTTLYLELLRQPPSTRAVTRDYTGFTLLRLDREGGWQQSEP